MGQAASGNTESMRKLATPLEPLPAFEPSVIPAIDALVGRYTGRDVVAATEVVDLLLDLRLLAEADQLFVSGEA